MLDETFVVFTVLSVSRMIQEEVLTTMLQTFGKSIREASQMAQW